jgi:hypothetical protein
MRIVAVCVVMMVMTMGVRVVVRVSNRRVLADDAESRRSNAGTHDLLRPDGFGRDPNARRTSSSGTPASISAPSTMSPDAPEKQSKYRIRKSEQSYQPSP